MTDDRVLVEAEAFRLKAGGLVHQVRHAAARLISSPAQFHPIAGLEMFLNPQRLSQHLKAAEQGATDGSRNHPPVDAEDLSAFEAGVRMKCNDALLRLKRQIDAMLIGSEAKLFAIDIQPIGTAVARIEAVADRQFQTFSQERRERLIQLRKAQLSAYREMQSFIVHNQLGRGAKPLRPMGLTLGLLVLMILIEGLFNAAIFGPITAFGLTGGFVVAAMIASANVLFAFSIGMFLVRNCIHRHVHRRIMGGAGALLAIGLLLSLQFTLAKFRSIIEGAEALPTVPDLLGPAKWSLPSLALFVISVAFAAVALADGFCVAGDPYPGYSAMARVQARAAEAYLRGLKEFRSGAQTLNTNAQNAVQGLTGGAKTALFTYQRLTAEFRSMVRLYEENAHQIGNACNRVIKDYREKNLFVRTQGAPAYFGEYLPLDWSIGREIGDPGDRLEVFTTAVDEMEMEAQDAVTRLHNLLVRQLQDIDDDLAEIDGAAAILEERESVVFKHAAGIKV